jgi:protein-tyrosine phosphatase
MNTMRSPEPFVDIHCHLLPGIDDGAKSWDESLEMARMAVVEGTETIVVTPHQLGAFRHNAGAAVRVRTAELQRVLAEHDIPLRVLPGADVRIEPDMMALLRSGDVLTLADRGKHVLLELPHELYFPLEPVLDKLRNAGMVGILSHPERNQGLLKRPSLLEPLVQYGCLMQITAGSLLGTFGADSRELSEHMLEERLVHFVATDAHGSRARRPLMLRAFTRVVELADETTAVELCCRNPAAVAEGRDVEVRRRTTKRRVLPRWMRWLRAAG